MLFPLFHMVDEEGLCMNWDAIGAVGEMIGAAAVVISVIYLATQIRKQTQEGRLAATRELASQTQGLIDHMIARPKLAANYLKAVQRFDELPNEERFWASMYFMRMFRVMEQQLLHSNHSSIEHEYFESVEKTIEEMLSLPGVQQWWNKNDYMFSSLMRDYVKPRLVKAKEKGYESTFKMKES